MKIYTSLALASLVDHTFQRTSSLAAAQTDSTYHDPLNLFNLRRSYLTCQETYGGGSEICGDPATSHYCYDPTFGDICCVLDYGYCKKGDFCAPVQGYCCHDGEDPTTCSLRLGFTLPPNLAADAASPSTSSTPSPLTSTIAISLAAAAVSDSPVLVSSSETSTTDVVAAATSETGSVTTTIAVGSGVVGSATLTGMTPEFTAPLNQTGGVGNGTGGAVETGGGSGSASGTGIGNGNGSVPATEQFTGAGAEGRSIGRGLLVVGMLGGVAVLFGFA